MNTHQKLSLNPTIAKPRDHSVKERTARAWPTVPISTQLSDANATIVALEGLLAGEVTKRQDAEASETIAWRCAFVSGILMVVALCVAV